MKIREFSFYNNLFFKMSLDLLSFIEFIPTNKNYYLLKLKLFELLKVRKK